MSKNETSTIELRPDGPLLVSKMSRLINEAGEEVETKEVYALCRCGGSENKPFCDGTHKRNGYSSHRETGKLLDRYRAYEGEKVRVEDDRTICAHAKHCVTDLPEVFNVEGRPWITPDGASVEAITELTHKCPSGALLAFVEGERADKAATEERITIAKDGPYEVEGPIELQIDKELRPPVSDRYTLCRCGASKNKPYCDGSHLELESGWGKSS